MMAFQNESWLRMLNAMSPGGLSVNWFVVDVKISLKSAKQPLFSCHLFFCPFFGVLYILAVWVSPLHEDVGSASEAGETILHHCLPFRLQNGSEFAEGCHVGSTSAAPSDEKRKTFGFRQSEVFEEVLDVWVDVACH